MGNIRTALFAWLFARHTTGAFILRIEDTDQARKTEGSLEAILDALSWLGMDIDEGVVSPTRETGDKGPYFQSQRLGIYKEHVQELIDNGHAYQCFCSPARLEKLRAEQQKKGEPPRYDKHCLHLSKQEVNDHLLEGGPFVVRMKVPESGQITFTDTVKGNITIDAGMVDHQVLLKSDEYPTYHLASVVDDHLMNISHVIRSDEWIASTPKHVLLYQYFGWDQPEWVHVPIVLGQDKSKLSKRHGAVSVGEYRKQGYLPDALVNYLALLGWNPKTEQELFSRKELITQFDLSKINKNNPVFDVEKLNWMSNHYIQQMALEDLCCMIMRLSETKESVIANLPLDTVRKAVALVRERMERLTDFAALTSYLWQEVLEYRAEILVPKKGVADVSSDMLKQSQKLMDNINNGDWNTEHLRQVFFAYAEKHTIKRGDMLWPLRVAVTGMEHSPDLFGTMDVLGKTHSLNRVAQAIAKLA